MKKKIGLLMLASAALLVPSCGRRLLRKTAAQLVTTYKNFPVDSDDTKAMIKKVKMNWSYGGTAESAIGDAQTRIKYLTGVDNADKSGSTSLTPEHYNCFFEVGTETGHLTDKDYVNDLIKWNVSQTMFSVPGGESTPIFDIYYPENVNYTYRARINDLLVDGPIFEDEKKIGEGDYHYDEYGRLLECSLEINYKTTNGKVKITLDVNASYNPIKE